MDSYICPKLALETCIYPEYVIRLQKERQILQKLFFLWKIRAEACKVITNSLKTKDFVTPISCEIFSFHLNTNR